MGATGQASGPGRVKEYTSASSADTTSWDSAPEMADWIQIIGAGSTVAEDERGTSVTITTDAAEPAAVIPGPWSAFTSTTATRVRMGNGPPPAPVVPASAVPATTSATGGVRLSAAPAVAATPIAVGDNDGRLDYVAGTALTDTAATTVQRAAIKTSFLLAGTMSQNETITLGTTGAEEGDYIKIIRTSTSAYTAAIVNGGAGAGTLHTQPASKPNFTEARFDGTNWLLSACGTA